MKSIITITMEVEDIEKIEELRGQKSKSEFLREIILKEIKNEPE